MHAILGKHDRIKRDGLRYDFMDILINPNFTALQFHDTSDIAIMKTTKRIMFSDVVKPICLPPDNSKEYFRMIDVNLINKLTFSYQKLVTIMRGKKLPLLVGDGCGQVEIILDFYKNQKLLFKQRMNA